MADARIDAQRRQRQHRQARADDGEVAQPAAIELPRPPGAPRPTPAHDEDVRRVESVSANKIANTGRSRRSTA